MACACSRVCCRLSPAGMVVAVAANAHWKNQSVHRRLFTVQSSMPKSALPMKPLGEDEAPYAKP